MRTKLSINLGPLSEILVKSDDEDAMFQNRKTAGAQLAEKIQGTDISPDIVLALNKDSLPVGKAIIDTLSVPLNILVVNKIEAPFNTDLAIGAVTSTGTTWLNDERIETLDIDQVYVNDGIRVEQERAEKQVRSYSIEPVEVTGQTVVLISDGIDTEETLQASVRQLREDGADKVVIATPVIARETLDLLSSTVDEILYLEAPETFTATSQHYEEFKQITDEDAKTYLQEER